MTQEGLTGLQEIVGVFFGLQPCHVTGPVNKLFVFFFSNQIHPNVLQKVKSELKTIKKSDTV
jgi:hypothetical protein